MQLTDKGHLKYYEFDKMETAKGVIDLKMADLVLFSYVSSADGAAAASVDDEFRIYIAKESFIFRASKTHVNNLSVRAWEAAIRRFSDKVKLSG